jgi:hypothetical protein
MREKDEKLFEAAVDLLFSIGFDNLTEEMAAEALHETNSPIKLYQVQPNLMTQKLDIRELR